MAEIRINRENYFNNLKIISSHVGGKEKVAVVLKDNAYGHGLELMAKLASEYGITIAVVRKVEEALQVVDFFQEVIVLEGMGTRVYEAIPASVTLVINAMERIPSGCSVELKVDSGMHRNGVAQEELRDAMEKIKSRNLKLKGVMTHLRAGDDLNSELFWQLQNWKQIKERAGEIATELDIGPLRFHSASSSATFRQKVTDDDLVRVGIASYGYLEWHETFGDPGLKPVLSLWADKVASRRLELHHRIGYSGISQLEKPGWVSTYDIGYGDGFFRINRGQEYMTPSGQRLLPRVSMDYVSVEGDAERVCLFDDARTLAGMFQTITYDVTTKLSPFIQRRVV